jgi:hypothetical protein
MLSDDTKITIRNGVAVLIFIAGLLYGYMITIGSIENRLTVLEANDKAKDQTLKDIRESQIRQEDKLDRLIERTGK